MDFDEDYKLNSSYYKEFYHFLYSHSKIQSPFLGVNFFFYPPSSSLSNWSLSCWMSKETGPIKYPFPYFVIMKGDFKVFSFLGHLSFNVAEIR